MKITFPSILSTLLLVLAFNGALLVPEASNAGTNVNALDYNETTHLAFIREEEKLARDVYATLGEYFPQAVIFSNIASSEERHTSAVAFILEKYAIPDPNTDDAVGEFTGDEWGWYFTDKYAELIDMGKGSLLNALYVGALIEELDMHDIAFCPVVIVDTSLEIEDRNQCGQIYTEEKAILRMYQNLLQGSANHLRAFVHNIELFIGEGNYEAQYLTQAEVDAILGR